MTTLITKKMVIDALEEAVSQRGWDYVYTPPPNKTTCLYLHADGPGCGVGLALSILGVPDSTLGALNSCGMIDMLKSREILVDCGWEMAPDAVAVFATFQELQDGGSTWGESLSAARQVAG